MRHTHSLEAPMSRSTIAFGALALACLSLPVRAQSSTELDPGPLVDFASLGTTSEVEPLDRITAQRALQGNYQSEDFKLSATKQEGDAEGLASLFTVTNDELIVELHEHAEDGATLTFAVGEKKLSAVVKHSHGH